MLIMKDKIVLDHLIVLMFCRYISNYHASFFNSFTGYKNVIFLLTLGITFLVQEDTEFLCQFSIGIKVCFLHKLQMFIHCVKFANKMISFVVVIDPILLALQTIAVISVEPWGVVEFGSTQKVSSIAT